MNDPSLVVLAALVDIGRTDAGVAAAFGDQAVSVWEKAPHGGADPTAAAYPFVRIGEFQVNGLERLEHVGRDGEIVIDDPAEVFATIHVFSQPRDVGGGKAEAVRITGAFALALSLADDIALEPETGEQAFRLVLCEITATRHFTDPDGITAHSVLTVRFEIEPSEG